MKIFGITRVRNEEHIIADTIAHVKSLGVEKIYVYDDCSTDRTPDICEELGCVVIRGKEWATTPEARNTAEGSLRTAVYRRALLDKPDWIYYFDADEFADFDDIDFSADAYRLRLFDFYITEEDKEKPYTERKFMGPEYRDILMLFKANPDIVFYQREPKLPIEYGVRRGGFVKHYGKAISIEEWEKTCDYYVNNRGGKFLPKFTDKWMARKGKAVHSISDFGSELIKWDVRRTRAIPLND